MNETLLKALDDQLGSLRARRAELERELAAVREEEAATVQYRSRLTGEPLGAAGPARRETRTVRVERLLREAEGGLTRKELVAALAAEGEAEEPNNVSSSLAYLRRNGRADKAGGVWSAPSA